MPSKHDRVLNKTYQKHGVLVVARTRYCIEVMIFLPVECRISVLDTRV
jgi:hypothetical protein